MANFTFGLDLGQARDFSALVVVERLEVFSGRTRMLAGVPQAHVDERYDVRHIERFALGTPYPAVVDRLGELLNEGALRLQTELVLDATGVGRAVVDMFNEAHKQGRLGDHWPVPVTITSGIEAHGLHVPKRDLVSRVQALLQLERLKIAEGLPLADVLIEELLAFRSKISKSGRDTYEAWRESDHDDLVLALALACWYRHRRGEARYVDRHGEVWEKAELRR